MLNTLITAAFYFIRQSADVTFIIFHYFMSFHQLKLLISKSTNTLINSETIIILQSYILVCKQNKNNYIRAATKIDLYQFNITIF